jgi:hypothetical protein
MQKIELKADRKRIYNPRTGKYYALRLHSTNEGRKGRIKGLWKNPKKPFHFYKDVNQPLGVYADSLSDLGEKIKSVDIASIEFHLERGDFESWAHYVGNTNLEKRLKEVKEEDHKGEHLLEKLCKIIAK